MMLYLKPKVVNILGKTCFINLLSFLLILPKAVGPLLLWSENKTCCCYYISKSKIYWVKYLHSLSIFLKMIRYTSSRNFIWSSLKPIIQRIMKLRHHTRAEILGDCSYKCNQFVLKASIRYTHKNVRVHAAIIAYTSQVHKEHFRVQQQYLKCTIMQAMQTCLQVTWNGALSIIYKFYKCSKNKNYKIKSP